LRKFSFPTVIHVIHSCCSFRRTSRSTLHHNRVLIIAQVGQATRRYSTAPAGPSKASNRVAVTALGAGLVGAATYAYLELGATPPKQEKSPLDPENFKDFKLKKIVPYNHNTSK